MGVTQTGEVLAGSTQTGVVRTTTLAGEVLTGPTQTGENADLVEAPVFLYGLAAINDTLDPDISLDTDQSAGNTIPDVSGNGRDFTVDGVETNDFVWRKNLTLFPYLPGRLELSAGADWTSDAQFDAQHSMIIPLRGSVGFGTRYVFDSAADRFALSMRGGGTGGWGVFDTGARYTNYLGGDVSEFMLGFTFDAGNSVRLFANGLFVEEISPVAAVGNAELLSGQDWTLGKQFRGTSASDYDFFGFIYKNNLLTDLEHYETWRRATRLEHHFKTHVAGTSLATGLQRCWPMFDTDGADIMDVSGNANHGAAVGGPQLTTPPLELGFRTGIRFSPTQSLQWAPGYSLASDDWSLAFTYQEYLTLTRGIVGGGDTTDGWSLKNNEGLRVTLYGGGASATSAGRNAVIQHTERLVLTYDASASVLSLYDGDDGTEIASVDGSGLTFGSTSADTWILNNAPGANGGSASFTGMLEWNRILSPSEILAVWSEPEIGGAVPSPETKYVATDETAGTIPDSSGNGNGAAVLEGTPTPTESGGRIALTGDGSANQYLRMEAGIAAQVAASQSWTAAFAMYLDDPDSTFAINNSGGADLALFLQNATGLTFYGSSPAAVNLWNYDRAPVVQVTSYDATTHTVHIVINGVVVQTGKWTAGTATSFAADDLWSLNNIGTVDFIEAQLFDEALSDSQCVNLCRDMFNRCMR